MVLVITVGAAVIWWLWLRPQPTAPASSRPASATPATPTFDQARSDAKRLVVKGWDRQADFRRSAFGEAWSDDVNVEFGHIGCNTRDDVLRRDLGDLVVRPGTCFAQGGTLRDPYSGQTISFVRGPSTSDAVQIDHVVSLSDAWYKGARLWDDQRRRDFANDPRNLLAVDGKANIARPFEMRPVGFRRTRCIGARSSRGWSTSRPPTGWRCPATRSAPSPTCWPAVNDFAHRF
ncbi:MAG: hypothetical protein QOK18_1894 [Mycobacterium sp.]|nr:hypothetical protein [Mycobacterium sp.]